jgi:hypothetical protein
VEAESAQTACAALAGVGTGAYTLDEWEGNDFVPGEPIAVALASATVSGSTIGPGQHALADLVPGTPFAMNVGAPYVPSGATTRLVAQSTSCERVEGRWSTAGGECDPAPFTLPTLPLSAVSLPAHGQTGGTTLSTTAALAAGIDASGESGWFSLPLTELTQESRQLYFPMAGGLTDGLTAELVVANHHMTATTTVDIFMLGAGGQLINLYTDPLPLCAGGVRSYDVTTLAGPITGGGRGPAVLSLRVTSTNRDLVLAPPISAVVVMRGNMDAAAYSGADSSNPFAILAGGRDQAAASVYAIPGARRNAGNPPQTTVIAVQSTRGAQNSQVYVDFYDQRGRLVADDAYFVTRGDGAAVIDLSRPMPSVGGGDMMSLPDGFVGTALVRGAAPRDSLAVVSFDLPRRPADARSAEPLQAARLPFALTEAVHVIRSSDPSVPTPTGTSTPPERPPTPTPTATGTRSWTVFLPSCTTPRTS